MWYSNVQVLISINFQFNILNEKMYDLLSQIYKEIFEIFDTDMFHMGGDEVSIYNSNFKVDSKFYPSINPPLPGNYT